MSVDGATGLPRRHWCWTMGGGRATGAVAKTCANHLVYPLEVVPFSIRKKRDADICNDMMVCHENHCASRSACLQCSPSSLLKKRKWRARYGAGYRGTLPLITTLWYGNIEKGFLNANS